MKQYDVYRFQYNEPHSNHCFDGQLVVCKWHDERLMLVDTYWGNKYDKFQVGGDRKYFTEEEANKRGKLVFVCNLEDVEEINKNSLGYYDESDVYNLSYQHGCYDFYVKKKDAVKSKDAMLKSAINKKETLLYQKESTEREINRLTETIKQIEQGDTTVYV